VTAQPLYAITDEYAAVLAAIEEAGGVLSPELEQQLDAIADAWRQKVGRVALYIQNLERAAEAADAEAQRLRELATSRQRVADALRAYLLAQLQRTGEQKVETDLAVVRLQRNSRPAIRWTRPVEELPEAYRRVRIEPDGEAAYRTWKAGEPLPEGFSVEQGWHLRIR
jgi:hypothetical protein